MESKRIGSDSIAKVIKSIDDLKRIAELCIQNALKLTQEKIGDCIQETIDEYYREEVFENGSTPSVYERTYKLPNSLVKTEIIYSGDKYICQVKIDENYLNYKYPGTPGYPSLPATGYDVLTWNNEDGSHGGIVDGDWKIWEQAMNTLGGKTGIMTILIDKLKESGLRIK